MRTSDEVNRATEAIRDIARRNAESQAEGYFEAWSISPDDIDTLLGIMAAMVIEHEEFRELMLQRLDTLKGVIDSYEWNTVG